MPNEAPWRSPGLSHEERAALLLADLTLPEKIAQLGSHWERPPAVSEELSSDVAPLAHLFTGAGFSEAITYGLGHVTRAFGSEPISPAEGVALVQEKQDALQQNTRLGIPAIVHEECLTGFTTLGATVYPAAPAWGATFDPELIQRMSGRIGADMRAAGAHQGLSPVLDVVRDYRWGRVEEAIAEDPYLVGMIGTAYVRGLEEAGVIATLKHFAGYSASRAGRNHAPVSMGRRELEDVILPPFEMAIREGGARSVMNSYSDIDGVPAGISRYLLTEVLRERWGFTGTVVTDYWSIPFLMMMHHIAEGPAEAAAKALTAGIDIELPGLLTFAALAEPDAVDPELLDRAVLRVLRQKIELGMLDPEWRAIPERAAGDAAELSFDTPENRAISLEVAEKSAILLRNEGILPLQSPTNIALVGPAALDTSSLLGCYSFPNHVLPNYPDLPSGLEIPSLHDAFAAEWPEASIDVATGTGYRDGDDAEIAAAVTIAGAADVAVVALGDLPGLFGVGTSGEGCDAADLSLPGRQGELLEAVLQTGTPTVLLVLSGRPYALGDYADRCAAIVQAFLPGQLGAEALAGVVSGRINPSGRLPVGVPRIAGASPATYLAPTLGQGYSRVSALDHSPLYPFGYGLSYTEFSSGELQLSASQGSATDTVRATVTVTNSGSRSGADVVQLYVTDAVSSVVRPVRELVGFARVELDPGASATVEFEVHPDRLSFTDVDYVRRVEAGVFTFAVGSDSSTMLSSVDYTVSDSRDVAEGRVLVTPVRVS